jgi:hypothetical protein
MIQDDLAIVIAHEDHTSPGWQTKLACELQMMDDCRVLKFAWSATTRQAYRRVIRWAKSSTTQEVEAAIRLNDDNKTIPEMMREAASHIRSQIDASKARDPLTIALKELEEARARIVKLEETGKELCECASQLGWTSCEDPKWIKRAEKAVEVWRSLP